MAEQGTARLPAETSEHRGIKLILPFGAIAFIGALGSLVTCYGIVVAAAFFGGDKALGINPHLQAVVMWSFGLLAMYGLWRDRTQHEGTLPLAVGAAVLVFSLYVRYESRFEVLAYVLLVMAALLNQNAIVSALYRRVRQQSLQIEDFNQNLEDRVRRQVREIERLGRLKDFLSPHVAELVTGEGKEGLLGSHRRYIACLFCDIRDFTAFSESREPEETILLLQAYHERIGALVTKRHGTIGYRAGDGLMVFFNDPIPCEEPVLDAVKLALEIREAWQGLREHWRRLGTSIGIGIGIASGYATLGLVGNQGRADYTAIGNVVNVAARLCDRATDGEILMDRRAFLDVEDQVEARASGPSTLKGVGHPVETYSVVGLPDPPVEPRGVRAEPVSNRQD